jgi:hypothetical protein
MQPVTIVTDMEQASWTPPQAQTLVGARGGLCLAEGCRLQASTLRSNFCASTGMAAPVEAAGIDGAAHALGEALVVDRDIAALARRHCL